MNASSEYNILNAFYLTKFGKFHNNDNIKNKRHVHSILFYKNSIEWPYQITSDIHTNPGRTFGFLDIMLLFLQCLECILSLIINHSF